MFVDKETKAQAEAMAEKVRALTDAEDCKPQQSDFLFNLAEMLYQLK